MMPAIILAPTRGFEKVSLLTTNDPIIKLDYKPVKKASIKSSVDNFILKLVSNLKIRKTNCQTVFVSFLIRKVLKTKIR